jgi:hypothetical protein
MRAGHLMLLAIGIACLALAQGSASAPYLLASEEKPYECVPDAEIDATESLRPEEKFRCKEFCKRSLPVLRRPPALGGRCRHATARRHCASALTGLAWQNQARCNGHGRCGRQKAQRRF